MAANTARTLLTLMLWLLLPSLPGAQSQEARARQHFDAARKAAGTQWATAADFFAMTADEIRPSLPSSGVTPTEPATVFDSP